jgi:hypothetical protein
MSASGQKQTFALQNGISCGPLWHLLRRPLHAPYGKTDSFRDRHRGVGAPTSQIVLRRLGRYVARRIPEGKQSAVSGQATGGLIVCPISTTRCQPLAQSQRPASIVATHWIIHHWAISCHPFRYGNVIDLPSPHRYISELSEAMGRKPIGKRAMTGAERIARWRAKHGTHDSVAKLKAEIARLQKRLLAAKRKK